MLMYLALIENEADKRKFETLYVSYKQTMYYVAYRILKNIHTAEDAVHLAFIRVIKNLDKIDENNCHKTRGFLVIITENIALDLYRKQKRENALSYDDLEPFIQNQPMGPSSDTEDLYEAMKKLPIKDATLLKLRYSHGYKDHEIGLILDISAETVRKRISRAKIKLGALLKKAGE